MAREFADAFYHSKRWRMCRNSYIKKRRAVDGGLCETCHSEPGYIVHHKIELTPENINDPMIALAESNLKYDCLVCHNKEEKYGPRIEGMAEYEFDENGMPVQLTPPVESAPGAKKIHRVHTKS